MGNVINNKIDFLLMVVLVVVVVVVVVVVDNKYCSNTVNVLLVLGILPEPPKRYGESK